MNINRAAIEASVERPSETLDVELKTWLDLTQSNDIAKTVRALLALRNRNGGLLVIGFNDKSRQPDPLPSDYVPEVVFHPDAIQLLVSKYAFEPFSVAVEFVERRGRNHPVLIVESGVQYPVAVKSDLLASGKTLLRVGEVPFRTLRANGTVSTASARPGDWKEIMEICFQNREADIGAFIRRHLSTGGLPELLGVLAARPAPPPALPERCETLMETACERFRAALTRQGSEAAIHAAETWGTWETALIIDPPLTGCVANDAFLGTIMASVPDKDSEWPLWTDTRYWDDHGSRPIQVSDGWEALVDTFGRGSWDILQFWRAEPTARFYSISLLNEDMSARTRGARPPAAFDPGITVRRVAYAILTGISLAKSLGYNPQSTALGFRFRWRGLHGRPLVAWLSAVRLIRPSDIATDNEKATFVMVPLETAPSAISAYVNEATKHLFALFNGATVPISLIERQVQELVS